MSEIDFSKLWERCPKGELRRRCVFEELYNLNPERVRAFVFSISKGDLFTRPPERNADDLTKDEWRGLFEEMGANGAEVRQAVWELGFGFEW